MKPDVYFSSIKNRDRTDCLESVLNSADRYFNQFEKGSFVGVKMTIGDEGSTGYIKPELVNVIIERLKEQDLNRLARSRP